MPNKAHLHIHTVFEEKTTYCLWAILWKVLLELYRNICNENVRVSLRNMLLSFIHCYLCLLHVLGVPRMCGQIHVRHECDVRQSDVLK